MANKNRVLTPKMAKKREEIARKEAQALELRKAGGQYPEIARKLGYKSKQGAYEACKRALAAITREPAEELLALYCTRLDRMYLGLVKHGAHDGDPRAVLAAVRVLEMHAKLSGYLKTDVNVAAGQLTISGPVIMVPPEREPTAPATSANAETTTKAEADGSSKYAGTAAAPAGLEAEPGPAD